MAVEYSSNYPLRRHVRRLVSAETFARRSLAQAVPLLAMLNILADMEALLPQCGSSRASEGSRYPESASDELYTSLN